VEARGHPPVDVAGAGYYLSYQLQPDPDRSIALSVETPGEERTAMVDKELSAAAGPVLDRNGNPVPDGTAIELRFTDADGMLSCFSAATKGGMALASFTPSRKGPLTVSAGNGGAASPTLTVEVKPASEPVVPIAPGAPATGGVPPALIAVPRALVAALAVGLAFLRRRRPPRAAQPIAPPPQPQTPQALRLDMAARKVFVDGRELLPPLSRDQFRLLAYIYERVGQVCSRDEIAKYVWPGAELSGISEEAIDSLVHRLRERLRQSGSAWGVITTVRGQGFRLEM